MKYTTFASRNSLSTLRKAAGYVFLIAAAVLIFFLFYVNLNRATPVLMYHEVKDGENNSLLVSPRNFEKQMKFLHDEGYKVISMDELVDRIRQGQTFIPKTVAITFDDGLAGNYLNAFPVLSRYKMPATIFLITGCISEKDEYLTWDQVRVMSRNGIDLGGHTRNHVYLPSARATVVIWDEVAGCREDIKKNTGVEARYFSYPAGGFDQGVEEVVKKVGYFGACTTNRGKDRLNRNVYELNRVKITNSDMNKLFHFRAKLSGYYNVFRKMKKSDDGYMKKKN